MIPTGPLPAGMTMYGSSPVLLHDELDDYIRDAMTNAPRSQQVAIGPSELGDPCTPCLVRKLTGTPNPGDHATWQAEVGTAVHAHLARILDTWNSLFTGHGHGPRFLIEQRVTVGQIGGVDISGSCDLYDRVTGTVVDWKTKSRTQLAVAKTGPAEQHRIQAHLYGRGYAAAGLPVHTVAIYALPRDGDLRASVWWDEPYNEQVAVNALNRCNALLTAATRLGVDRVLAGVESDPDCWSCKRTYKDKPSLTDLLAG